MLSIDYLLLLSAFVTTIASAIGKSPVWVPLLLVVLFLMLETLW